MNVDGQTIADQYPIPHDERHGYAIRENFSPDPLHQLNGLHEPLLTQLVFKNVNDQAVLQFDRGLASQTVVLPLLLSRSSFTAVTFSVTCLMFARSSG